MDGDGGTPDGPPQGWFADPFGVHAARWFSQGTPTALVRDGRVEAQDPPPAPVWTGPLLPARIAPEPDHPSGDLRRADGAEPEFEPHSQFDFFGNPARPGEVGAPTTAGEVTSGVPLFTFKGGGPPPTPRRIVNYRWTALALSFGWTVLLTALILSATTSTRGPGGHERSTSVYATDPAAVILFLVFLVLCCSFTGIGLYRRIRSESERADRVGYAIAGVLFLLGVLSLASIGLTLVVLAFALCVVARPIKRPRPLPGEATD